LVKNDSAVNIDVSVTGGAMNKIEEHNSD